jgi:hypothetical protein
VTFTEPPQATVMNSVILEHWLPHILISPRGTGTKRTKAAGWVCLASLMNDKSIQTNTSWMMLESPLSVMTGAQCKCYLVHGISLLQTSLAKAFTYCSEGKNSMKIFYYVLSSFFIIAKTNYHEHIWNYYLALLVVRSSKWVSLG